MITFKEIDFFLSLCEYSNVGRVAEEFKVTQSAVSIAIKSLENKTGERLFDRIGKKLVLNERGRYFKEIVKPHFLFLKDAQNIFAKDKISGSLKVISSKTISDYLLAEPIYRFLLKFKEVKIEKKTANSFLIVESIHKGEFDIGFIESEIKDIEIEMVKITQDELIVVSSDEALSKKEVFIDTLFDRKWILRERGSGTRDIFLKKLGHLAQKLNIFLEFSEFEEIKSILCHKDTITCISKHAVKRELREKRLYEVKLKNLSFKRNLYMIYHKNKSPTKLFEEFKNFIKREIKNLPL